MIRMIPLFQPPSDVIGLYVGLFFTALVGLLNWYSLSRRNVTLDKSDERKDMKTLNEAIQLANQRALEAEKNAIALEISHKQEMSEQLAENQRLEDSYAKLDTEFSKWRKSLAIRMVFDILLDEPKIENLRVSHISEKRENDSPHEEERRT